MKKIMQILSIVLILIVIGAIINSIIVKIAMKDFDKDMASWLSQEFKGAEGVLAPVLQSVFKNNIEEFSKFYPSGVEKSKIKRDFDGMKQCAGYMKSKIKDNNLVKLDTHIDNEKGVIKLIVNGCSDMFFSIAKNGKEWKVTNIRVE